MSRTALEQYFDLCSAEAYMYSEAIAKCYLCSLNGAQWLSGRVLHLRPRGLRFEPHCVVSLIKTH